MQENTGTALGGGGKVLCLTTVYGGKAFGGLLADISARQYEAGDNALFIMTDSIRF